MRLMRVWMLYALVAGLTLTAQGSGRTLHAASAAGNEAPDSDLRATPVSTVRAYIAECADLAGTFSQEEKSRIGEGTLLRWYLFEGPVFQKYGKRNPVRFFSHIRSSFAEEVYWDTRSFFDHCPVIVSIEELECAAPTAVVKTRLRWTDQLAGEDPDEIHDYYFYLRKHAPKWYIDFLRRNPPDVAAEYECLLSYFPPSHEARDAELQATPLGTVCTFIGECGELHEAVSMKGKERLSEESLGPEFLSETDVWAKYGKNNPLRLFSHKDAWASEWDLTFWGTAPAKVTTSLIQRNDRTAIVEARVMPQEVGVEDETIDAYRKYFYLCEHQSRWYIEYLASERDDERAAWECIVFRLPLPPEPEADPPDLQASPVGTVRAFLQECSEHRDLVSEEDFHGCYDYFSVWEPQYIAGCYLFRKYGKRNPARLFEHQRIGSYETWLYWRFNPAIISLHEVEAPQGAEAVIAKFEMFGSELYPLSSPPSRPEGTATVIADIESRDRTYRQTEQDTFYLRRYGARWYIACVENDLYYGE